MTVAVMGCMVNGPGEAKEADIGVACGRRSGIIIKKGRVLRRVKEDRIISDLVREVERAGREKTERTKR
jgi:(E)-4-hydroxy-3-methylbut-2-enyl-diphosphate synthase